MSESFNPEENGYTTPGRKAMPYGDGGWIVVHPDRPPIACERDTGWYCLLLDFTQRETSIINNCYRVAV